MIKRLLLFLFLNFAALGLGSYFTGDGVISDWYLNLNKAPWTPPGWVFGAAWTFIMVCFSIFMAYAYELVEDKSKLIKLFGLQWILNVLWNPIFFYFNNMLAGLICITALLFLVAYFLFAYRKELKSKSLLMLPYFIWLIIATSLNAYALIYN